ncbi:hypothetical protein BJ165DRAFT_1604935 [Panaeolus papilionaceus]|nr:hypothetical protein BJ165DRAFT_1604935 [Panaeolus papilionaceus]
MIAYGTSLDDVDSRITYSAGWDLKLDNPIQMTGTTHFTSTAGATTEFRFEGSAIAVVSTIPRGDGVVRAMFTLDDEPTVMVTHSAIDVEQRDVAFWRSKTLSSSAHVLKITALGGDVEFSIDRFVYTPNSPILFPIEPPVASPSYDVDSTSLTPDFTTPTSPSTFTPEPTRTIISSPSSSPDKYSGMSNMMSQRIPIWILLASIGGIVLFFIMSFALCHWWSNARRSKREGQSPLGNRMSFSPPPHRRSPMSPFNSISVRTYRSPAPPGHRELPEMPTLQRSTVSPGLHLGSAFSMTDRRPATPPISGTGPILPTYSPLAPPPPALQRRRSRVLDRLDTFRLGISRRAVRRPYLRPLYLSTSPSGLQHSNFAPSSTEATMGS